MSNYTHRVLVELQKRVEVIEKHLFLESKLPICPLCERRKGDIDRRRLNTAYVNDESNYQLSCEECYDESVGCYEELWDDFYSEVL